MHDPDNTDNSLSFADYTFHGTSRAMRYKLDIAGNADVSVVPMSMVASGAYHGCYDNLRVWVNGDGQYMRYLIGYVRIVFHETNGPLIYYRRTWADEWQLYGAVRNGLHYVLLRLYGVLFEMFEESYELGLPLSDPSTSYATMLAD